MRLACIYCSAAKISIGRNTTMPLGGGDPPLQAREYADIKEKPGRLIGRVSLMPETVRGVA
jgi:hypothetical protein